MEKIPLVSVVIPMFNSAKFIPQTLESLLYQTMTDFEVIVIDDCSTDNSVAVVEKFSAQFGGRLHVIKLPKNTGMPGLPRNVGIQFARGKYIAFLDSDDLYTKTALEELSTLAEAYKADVVHTCDTYRLFNGRKLSIDAPEFTDFSKLTDCTNWSFSQWRKPVLPRPQQLNAPTLKPETLMGRVDSWIQWKYRLGVCANFCHRNFLIANQIFFPDMVAAEDQVFNFACLCLAKNFLRAPNVTYIVRPRMDSLSRDSYARNIQYFENYLRKWIKVIKVGFNEFEKVMARIPFFKNQLPQRYAVLEFFFNCVFIRHIAGKYAENHSPLIYQFIKKIFQSEDAALTAYLLNTVNIYRLKIIQLQAENNEMKKLAGELIKRFESKEFQR